jgi:hypothetical protein
VWVTGGTPPGQPGEPTHAAAVVLLSPVFAFLIAIAVEILIGAVKDAGLLACLALVIASVIGWMLFSKLRVRPRGSGPVET